MAADPSIETHPVQVPRRTVYGGRSKARMPTAVTLRAYEVYCHLYGPQEAMIDDEGKGCRGGFGVGEIVAFLYARSFPKEEWERRVQEAFRGMDLEA